MSHRENSLPERPMQRIRRALLVLRGIDCIDEHPDAWAYRARWSQFGERTVEERIRRAQARNQ